MSYYVHDNPIDENGLTFPEQIRTRIEKGMGCGSGIGKGWLPIIVELDEQLSKVCPDYVIDQIKEKFGGLRFYASNLGNNTQQAYDLIRQAEEKADATCEVCGGPGTARGKGWIRTVCDEHAN